jgi:hypothetical protein
MTEDVLREGGVAAEAEVAKWAAAAKHAGYSSENGDIIPSLCESVEALRADVAFLAERAIRAGIFSTPKYRDFGRSSNAIVRLAYGGPAPEPDEVPFDETDCRACQLAVMRLPEHRRTEAVLEALRRAEAAWKRHETETGR